ncbi:sigma-70 family RNA polymerase sigma factor [Pontiellaceae bacterium B12227]|nr:sigma-70 family RNA polymerase sigma factor [Pontiellaceae bacterium B12227]
MTDKQLINRFATDKDDKAFGLLVERYINVAYAAAINYLGSEDLARDACQLTFVELSKKADALSGPVQLGGWIYATARNMARNIQKAEARRRKREESYADELMQKTTQETDWTELGPELHEALERLKPADRDAVILRFFQGKNLAEVGNAMGVSADAARMRLNRALEQMGGQLAKKGVTSTAAALAAALPAHAASTAPAGLASTISTAVLTGTGISTTATLTGVIIAAMKTKIIVISTAVAATALIGTGVYLSNRTCSTDTQTEAASVATEAVSAPAKPQSDQHTAETVSPISEAPSSEITSISAQGETAESILNADSASLDISPEYLKKAEQTVALLEMALPLMNNDMVKTAMADQVENPSKQLQVRLDLDPEIAEKFDAVLADHIESETRRVNEMTSGMMNSMKQMLEDDREAAVNFMALQSMLEAGEPLSPEQQAFQFDWAENMKKNFVPENGEQPESTEPRQWYEDESVLNDLNALLTEPQQDELLTHVLEKEKRELEQRAYDRTGKLANTLGLNEADRSALYDYLYKNPEATNEDISEQLAPELRELMPKDDGVPAAGNMFSITAETKPAE